MNNRFFKPYIGKKYNVGINGKRVLVIGASFYCSSKNCPFFNDCTDVVKKDSSKYDNICPVYSKEKLLLSEEPWHTVGNEYRTYKVFANFIGHFIKNNDYHEIWEHLAFTNYVQFFVRPVTTHKKYLSERDFNAFIETLSELKPNIVISWGTVFLNDIRRNNPYVIDNDLLEQNEYYICHMRSIPEVPHDITLVSGYHPSSIRYWYNDLEKLKKYFNLALNE